MKDSLFVQLGYSQEDIDKRLEDIVNTIFFGKDDERFYYEEGDIAYVMDTGNNDVRTEGMSYAMMAFVQLDMQEHFDKIWNFSKTYMFMEEGDMAGYFAWSVQPDGTKNAYGPAPDGEEYYAMALILASKRWGNGEGIYNYAREAKELLATCIHHPFPMWEPSNYLIKFVPNLDFSDPSYHLPHFYRIFAKWCNEEDREFWEKAADASRQYLKAASHEVTGLTSEYADYEGKPFYWYGGHDVFYSDAYRTVANIGLYAAWFGDDAELSDCAKRLHRFFKETVPDAWDRVYRIDGTPVDDEKALHPVGLIATNAMGALANVDKNGKACVHEFYNTPLRQGDRRYYDNFLYLFAFMALSGHYEYFETI